MTKIKYAIFDVGNTIYPYTLQPLNDLMLHYTTDKNAFLDGHSAFDYSYKPYMRGKLTHQDLLKDLCKFCHVTYDDKLIPLINTAFRQGRGEMFKETMQVMQLCHSHGIEIGILSNALPILSDAKIELAKPEYVFVSYELGLLKPDIKIFQTLVDRLQTAPTQILFIDDKESNITAAKQIGINGIIFNKDTILKEITECLYDKRQNQRHAYFR